MYQYQSPASFSTVIAGATAAVFLFASTLITSPDAFAEEARLDFDLAARNLMEPPQAVPELRPRLQAADQLAALEAVQVALTQASDGATYVWRHPAGRVSGAVAVTRTFRDADGRMCRHLDMLLTSGAYSRRREGIACRQADGVWDLEG